MATLTATPPQGLGTQEINGEALRVAPCSSPKCEVTNGEGARKGYGRVVFAANTLTQTRQKPRPADGLTGGELHQASFCKSSIQDIYYTYPLKILIPQFASTSNCQWVYPVTFGGGLVEGDLIDLEVTVQEGCAAMVTTQASTKVYQCPNHMTSTQTATFDLRPNALLAVIPDAIVCYKGARYAQKQVIKMTAESNLILLDWHTAGRIARGEIWDFEKYSSSTVISVEGTSVFRDCVEVEDGPNLTIKQSMGKYQVYGMCVLLGPCLTPLVRSLVQNLGKPKSYGAKCENDKFVAVSPLQYAVKPGSVLRGCVLRFAAQTTCEAFQEVDKILRPLYGVLGGDPFENKY